MTFSFGQLVMVILAVTICLMVSGKLHRWCNFPIHHRWDLEALGASKDAEYLLQRLKLSATSSFVVGIVKVDNVTLFEKYRFKLCNDYETALNYDAIQCLDYLYANGEKLPTQVYDHVVTCWHTGKNPIATLEWLKAHNIRLIPHSVLNYSHSRVGAWLLDPVNRKAIGDPLFNQE